MASGNVLTSLKFLEWQELYDREKPFQIFINIPDDAVDKRNTNLVFEDVPVTVQDIRHVEERASLDDVGFLYRQLASSFSDFEDRAAVEAVYLPEVESLLRQELDGVDRVFFFDWRLRKNAPEIEGTVIDMNDLTTWLRPATHVHIDQSPAAALKRIQLQLKDDADFLLRGRVRIVNVWRPLIKSVEDWPLAICDGSTVRPEDLVEADHIRRHYMGSTMYLMHHENHKFYYMSKQSKDDVLIFKNFDSSSHVRARFAPHASFQHPGATEQAVPRESIEVRAFVFTYPG